MWFDESGDYLQGVEVCLSPNCDDRPDGVQPNLIVVHGISLPPNQFGGGYVHQLFLNQLDPDEDPYFKKIEGLRVSAHFFVQRGGEVTQFVSPKKRAWHAGISSYQGQERCNDFSIGIELEGTDDTPYTAIQYQQLAQIILALQKSYPNIPKAAVVGHSDIAPGRKTDPGRYFNWPALWRLINLTN
ncbi:1,6-anhydro-N-acetylmuramyl-L-alanine amidase AmpD [Thiomicrorhabdus indica]|uniref:1,6-anhydro-N-acetylmuramyl-L-alanine amidase AmpD n=1 Tax=Thiomicrorhabdus indica TaxID=2267253 RepID=UPI002AA7E33D|nr:1,6-anhydro-N-acetylmuramyl-L-alanine amidase AmpD [Thiomicrorhabdus indica]